MVNNRFIADSKIVKKTIFLLLLLLLPLTRGFSYRILYAEQYYRLYHLHFYQYPDDTMENIYYLEEALKADFCNPLYALARIENKKEWERYRNLFMMHVNLRLIDLYLTLGSKYDKMQAFFYNEPWKQDNLKSLEIAEQVYNTATSYWKEARTWSQKAGYSFLTLEQVQKWEDERYRIQNGDLNYGEIIRSHLQRLQKVRRDFMAMDENTY